ncbi:MAG: hypothetical protein IPL32_09500 [Chloracidobacterium sp.]|nr:hypothetical protein [Chloracidobacterium sp.]
MMKKQIFCILFLLLLANGASTQTVDKTVEKIQKYYADISEKARLCEIDNERGEFGELVMNELVINKRNRQWRAVGKYDLTYKFFYRGGDSEKHLYPDQLVKVVIDKKISNRKYAEEFLYSNSGALIFYFQKTENDENAPAERRVYFSAGQTIRIIEDGKARNRLNKKDAATVREIVADSSKIKKLFISSIKL